MAKTYLFYDLETSGLNPCFDQILQFAAIKTDENLKKIAEYEFFLKLNSDVIPTPEASITHCIQLNDLKSGVCEYEAMSTIHQLFNSPNTISLGYNTLGFDDEFLRFGFYRNLFSPYSHQFANGCTRMDVLPIALIYYLFENDVIQWPETNGSVNLKLENINQLNQLVTGKAHNAMTDVSATLTLSQKFFSRQKIWQFATGYFDKNEDMKRCMNLPIAIHSAGSDLRYGLMISHEFGSKNNFMAPVLQLGMHQHYRNQSLWLRLDLANLTQATPENFLQNTWVINKKFGEPGFLLPTADRFMERLNPERLVILEDNLKWLKQNEKALQTIIHYYQDYKHPEIENLAIDAALYTIGFASKSDEINLKKFHQASLKQKINFSHQFEKSIYNELLNRLLARNYPEKIDKHLLAEYKIYLQQINPNHETIRQNDFRNQKRNTVTQTLARIAELKKTALDANQLTVLLELEHFLTNCF